jgi:lipopolysaccharide/colanic/teichoic acid biosynthesis glycosyltransferase
MSPVIQGSFPAPALHSMSKGSAPQLTHDVLLRPPKQRRAVARPRVLSQKLFRDALIRERKRADRFDEAFVMMVVSFYGAPTQHARWVEVLDALTIANVETDVVGWYKQGSAMALIRSLVALNPGEAAAALSATVESELSRRLSPESRASCSIQLEVYSPDDETTQPRSFDVRTRREWLRRAARDTAKRLLDIGGGLACLMVLLPAFIVIAALVKLTSQGPIFHRQVRVGLRGRPFTMFKFRTMYENADERVHEEYVTQFIQSTVTTDFDRTSVFKIVNDKRVTPIGRFLRRSSLDEVPQFWNVLKGQMSLVGPRPPLPYEVACYKRWHRRRLFEAKPGITGLWQVTGRSRTTFEDMVRLDLRYANRHSFWTDLKLLLATPRAVVSGKGAH